MSPVPDPGLEALQQRYAEIEQVYAARNWRDVEFRCRSLLAEIPEEPSHPLRQRLLLLLAHTELYGGSDPAAAASLYAAVLAADPEAALAEIAAQGLELCGQPDGGERLTADDGIGEAALQQPPRGETGPAMPWLQELGDTGPRRADSEPSSQALAPFQLGAPRPEDGTPQEQADRSPQQAQGPDAEQPVKPLRWPFMADYVEQSLADSSAVLKPATPATTFVESATATDGPMPTEGGDDGSLKLTSLDAATPELESDPPTTPEPVAAVVIETLEAGRFSLEDIRDLSRGLLHVSLVAAQA